MEPRRARKNASVHASPPCPVDLFFLHVHLLPASSLADVVPARAHALVVVRVERKDALEDALRAGEVPEAPEAETVAMEAPQKRSVIDLPPLEEAIEAGGQRKLADPDAELVVNEGAPREVLEPVMCRFPGRASERLCSIKALS